MGFRDFTSFNQALVAKQGWRLLQFPDLLVSKVLQARYYRDSSFLRASTGTNPSFIWRSILWGRQVIKTGIRWRIGDGKKVFVYKDGWLPRPDTFKPVSPPSLPAETKVAKLMNNENQWDVSKLNQHFRNEDT